MKQLRFFVYDRNGILKASISQETYLKITKASPTWVTVDRKEGGMILKCGDVGVVFESFGVRVIFWDGDIIHPRCVD